MIFRKFSKWLLTDAGKKGAFYTACATSTGIMLAHFIPNTFLLDQYQKIIQYYRKGRTVPLSKSLQERFQKTLDLLEVQQQEYYKPFHVYGFDVMCAGYTKSKFGIIVGIPINFTFDSVDTASDKPSISIWEKPLEWNSENGRKLLDSLILSENAQIYAIGSQIRMRESWKPILDLVYAGLSAVSVYSVANHLNIRGNLYSKPRSVRLLMYSIVVSFFTTSYFMLKDLTTIMIEKSIDEELVNKNPLFAEGGHEFCTKMIERNKVLREIMGKHGENMYTALGNENTYIRTMHIPLVQRKTFFDEKLSGITSKA